MNSNDPKSKYTKRDETHMEQVVRWAEFVKSHPRAEWIKHTGPLVDSQIIIANQFYNRLSRLNCT